MQLFHLISHNLGRCRLEVPCTSAVGWLRPLTLVPLLTSCVPLVHPQWSLSLREQDDWKWLRNFFPGYTGKVKQDMTLNTGLTYWNNIGFSICGLLEWRAKKRRRLLKTLSIKPPLHCGKAKPSTATQKWGATECARACETAGCPAAARRRRRRLPRAERN